MDFLGLIRTLGILLVVWWAYKFFVEKGRSSRQEQQERQQASKPKSPNKKLNDNVGEYVDYEEVK